MVVDDDALVRGLLLDFLTVERYEVAAFGSGAEALQAVSTFQPDVILVDMRMPGLLGTQVRDELQRKGVTVPVILISGTPELTESGFFAALKKPFNVTTVAEVVAAAVNHRRTATGPA
jgi:FixJ family two-component response regulator